MFDRVHKYACIYIHVNVQQGGSWNYGWREGLHISGREVKIRAVSQLPNFRAYVLCMQAVHGGSLFFRDAHLNTKYWPMFHAETKKLPLVYNTNLL